MYLERNNFLGYWDDQNASDQEGIAYVCYDVSSKWGNPQLANHVHNYFGGLAVTRSVTYDGIVKSLPAAVGTQYGVLIYGMEVASIIGDYYGAVNQNSIAYRAKAGGYIAQHKIAECDFDASGQDNIFVQSTDGATAIYDISITNNTFTGEDCCPHAVFIQTVNGQYGGAPSIYGLNFDGNTVRDHMGSGLRILGARRIRMNGNNIFNYNTQMSSATDAQSCSAVWFDWSTNNIKLMHNHLGGGPLFTASHASGNNCYQGFSVGGGVTDQQQTDNSFNAPV